VNVQALLATGVNADGYREILGLHGTSAEDGGGWIAFFRDLVARGLTGVALVTRDAHRGLVEAIGATLPGASWQRCRTHSAANLIGVRLVVERVQQSLDPAPRALGGGSTMR
jgi:transposase-like protein